MLGLALVPLTGSAVVAAETSARIARHRAEAVADLAALAAAGPAGCAGAQLTANASEAVLVRCSPRSDASVIVAVRLRSGLFGPVDATARAGPPAAAAT
jgi:hypothetical protein